MNLRDYVFARKINGQTRLFSFKQKLNSSTGGFKHFCLKGKYLTSFIRIKATPSTATISIVSDNCIQKGNTMIVPIGNTVYVTVENDDYLTQEFEFVAGKEDYYLDIGLDLSAEFVLRVDTTKNVSNTNDNTFIVPFTSGTYSELSDDSINIDWGDGNNTTIENGVFTQENCSHIYSNPGSYDISITSSSDKIPALSFNDNYSSINNNNLKLVEIKSPLVPMIGTNGELETNLPNLFGGCSNLSSIVEDIFKYNHQIKNISGCFEGCNSLLTIPENILIYTPNIINVSYMFNNCDGIEEVPFGLLTSITTLRNCESMFNNCDNLKIIPNGLFSTNKTITNFTKCFENCKNLTINPNIFGDDYTYLSDINGINFSNMFYREQFDGTDCGSAPEIYELDYNELGGSINCFGGIGNEGLLNYWDIPHTWGGPEKIELTMDLEPNDVNAILYDYDLFELPYYKDEGWNRVQVNTTPNDASVNVVHALNGYPDEYQQNVIFSRNPGVIYNGVASGFTSTEYLKLPQTIPNCSKIEFGGKFKCNATSGVRCIFELSKNNWTGFNIAIHDDLLRLWCSSSSSKITQLTKDKYYWFKCVCDTSGNKLYISTDGINYVEDVVQTTNEFSSYVDSIVYIGIRGYNKSEVFTDGHIDLNECYIKIDDSLWWDCHDLNSNVVSANNTKKEFSSGSYYINLSGGEYDVIVVGAGGGGSGCSKHSDGASGASGAAFVGKVNIPKGIYKITVGAGGTGTPRMDWSRGGTGGSSSIGDVIIAGGGTGGALDASGGTGGTLTLNTQPLSYTVKSNGNNGAGGYGWGQTSTVASPYGSYGYGGYGGACDWQGGGTGGNGYISISGLFELNSFTVEKIGFWNNDGIISGFTTSNYIKHASSIGTITSFEQVMKVTTTTDITTRQTICAGDAYLGLGSFMIIDGKIKLYASSDGTTNDIAGTDGTLSTLDVLPNTEYYVKYHWNGTDYKIDLSTNGIDYVNYISISKNISPKFNGVVGIGTDTGASNQYPWFGMIDISKSYIKINGQLWWNNKTNTYKYWDEKYIQNYSINGTMLSVENGIAKGFNETNYLLLPQLFTPGNSKWEIVLKFNISSFNTTSTWINLFGNGNTTDRTAGIHIFYNTSGSIRVEACTLGASSWNIMNVSGTTILTTNKDYWVKVQYTGTQYIVYISTDGITYNQEASVSSSEVIGASATQSLGISVSHPTLYHNGIIYLNESYIKIDDEIWWDGKQYNKVGYYDSNGILTGINATNYITLKNQFNPSTSPWEVGLKFNTGSDFSTSKYPFGCTNADNGVLFGWDVNGVARLWVSSDGSSWNVVNSSYTGNYAMSLNTEYYAKIIFDGKRYTTLLSKDGKTWRYGTRVDSTVAVRHCTFHLGAAWDRSSSHLPTNGYIDLNECYININGVRWWDCINKDTSNYAVNIKDKEFLTLQNSKVLINVSKNGYNDNTKYYTIADDTTLNISL